MVRGLKVGIVNSKSEINPVKHVADLPTKGEKPHVIVDGVSLAYEILTPENKEHSWDFVNGGTYKLYSNKVIEFLAILRKYNFQVTVVFPLSDGTPPITPLTSTRCQAKAVEKLRRVARAKTMLEKNSSTSRTLLEVLPPMIVNEVAETAKGEPETTVLFTRNNVTRFCAEFVKSGKADAIIGQNSDYLIFEGVHYIPIDSIMEEEGQLKFELFTNEIAAQMLQLQDMSRLNELAILLGNTFTEPFVVQKYNISSLLHIRLNPKNPAALVDGVVEFLNGPDFESLEGTSPTKELISSDEEFRKAIADSNEFFSLATPNEPEGDSEIRKMAENLDLPPWAVAVAEGGDFWCDPIIDDYEHDIKTNKLTQLIRSIMYAILGRDKVMEHLPGPNGIIEDNELPAEQGFPTLAKIKKLKEASKKKTYYQIVHGCFPTLPDFKDPLGKMEEPFQTAGFAIRFLVSQCFTDNQSPHTLIKADAPSELVNAKVVGAPVLDLFEIKALATMMLVLNSKEASKFQAPSFKPKLRRVKVSALYQTTIETFIWLQQCLLMKSERNKPHRFYDGEIFAAAYEASGEMNGEVFSSYFEEPEKIIKLADDRLQKLIDMILAPFPESLFDAFKSVPRSMASNAFMDDSRPVVTEVKALKSKFSSLMDSEDEEEDVAPPPPPVVVAAPPPPPPKKQQKKKPADDDDEDMEAFLLAQAAKKKAEAAPAPAQAKPAPAAQKSKPKKPHVRKLEGSNSSQQVFNKESKNELKRQLKQQIFDYN